MNRLYAPHRLSSTATITSSGSVKPRISRTGFSWDLQVSLLQWVLDDRARPSVAAARGGVLAGRVSCPVWPRPCRWACDRLGDRARERGRDRVALGAWWQPDRQDDGRAADGRRPDHRPADIADRDVYVCGPPPMTEIAGRHVRAAGVPRRHIHTERFAL